VKAESSELSLILFHSTLYSELLTIIKKGGNQYVSRKQD
jgi:hypothetical protein